MLDGVSRIGETMNLRRADDGRLELISSKHAQVP
jgi:hypothetical protein